MKFIHILVSFKNVSCVDFVRHVVEDRVVAVGYDSFRAGLEGGEIVDDFAAEEGFSVFKRRLIDDNFGAFCFDAFHHALYGALAEVVGVGFHSQSVDSDSNLFFTSCVPGAGGRVVSCFCKYLVSNEVFAGTIGFYDRSDKVFRNVFEVGEELLSIFRKTVAAIAEGWVVVEVPHSRIEAHAFDDRSGVQAFDFGVGIEFVEEADAQG